MPTDDLNYYVQVFLVGTIRALIYVVGFLFYYRILFVLPKEIILEANGQPKLVQYSLLQMIGHGMMTLVVAAFITGILYLSAYREYSDKDLVWLFWIIAFPMLFGIYKGHRERYWGIGEASQTE